MPVVLSQHFLASDRRYEDAEYSLYHYPAQYFARIKPYDRFVYYRPLGKSLRRPDSLHYFGHGILGEPFADPIRSDHRFVPIVKGEPFLNLVSLKDGSGLYYETESQQPPVAVSAVREIGDITYHRILAAAGVSSTALERLPSTDQVVTPQISYFAREFPRDDLREINEIPAGAGYVPRGNTALNVYEAAALQERARADHQAILRDLAQTIHERGGRTYYNNNIDLLGDLAGRRLLIEAKSLNDPVDAVNRMRYGIGELCDYRFRYATELRGADAVLAFGKAPDANTAWIGDALEDNGIAFIARRDDRLIALNELAQHLPIF